MRFPAIYMDRKGELFMAMAWIWTGMAAVSLIFAAWNGTMDAVGAAALGGCGYAGYKGYKHYINKKRGYAA